ncbi:MAG: EpsG family protein [Polaribacter sp.]
MIPDGDLLNVFLLSITVLIFITVLPLFKIEKLKDFPKENLLIGSIVLLIITLLLIGLRNPYASWRFFGDTYTYNLYFHKVRDNSNWIVDKDFGFFYYTKILSQFVNVQMYFFINAFLYIFLVYFGLKKWFKDYTYFALALFITSFTFWGFGINTMRSGLAGSIFIFALSFYNKKWILIGLFALSLSIHLSLLLPIFVFLVVHFIKNSRLLIKIWLVSIPICFLL